MIIGAESRIISKLTIRQSPDKAQGLLDVLSASHNVYLTSQRTVGEQVRGIRQITRAQRESKVPALGQKAAKD